MKFFRWLITSSIGLSLILLLLLAFAAGSAQASDSLEVKTSAKVTEQGKVDITLTLTNTGSAPLFHIHPMLHFHHTMAMLEGVHRLGPGESITIENGQHPPVRLQGSYPLVAMVRYQNGEEAAPVSLVHTGSFSFKEAMPSEIEGSIVAFGGEEGSLLKVVLRNVSSSFKNVRMMLVLPPEIESTGFQKMKGLTLRSGEEKTFDIAVKKVTGAPSGQFPVHLQVEYGQMAKHYSGDITTRITFAPFWGTGPVWPHLLVVLFLSYGIFTAVRRRSIENLQKPATASG